MHPFRLGLKQVSKVEYLQSKVEHTNDVVSGTTIPMHRCTTQSSFAQTFEGRYED